MLKIRIKILLILFFVLYQIPVQAQTREKEKISKNDLRRQLSYLASDELSGRSLDTSDCGICRASDYLQKSVAKIGLKEGFPEYLQQVPLILSAPDTVNSFIEIRTVAGQSLDKTFGLPAMLGEKFFRIENVPVVFAGFGYKEEATGYNDFTEIDVKGKVVVVSTGTPATFAGNEKPLWNNQLEFAKILNATKAGAAAVVLVISPADSTNEIFHRLKNYLNRDSWAIAMPAQNTQTNFVIANAAWADKVLGEKGSFFRLLSGIALSKTPNSQSVENVQLTIEIKKKTKELSSPNIVGVVEGSDPVLKNECVVFMAHYDHLGIDKTGDVFNGADDNGSGTVTLLELAKAFNVLREKPKRSIVFLWVTGEEIGLLGSKYYTENPVFPLSKTAACINLDMVGRVFEPRDTVWNRSPKRVKDFDGIFAVTNKVWPGLKEITATNCEKAGLQPDFSLPSYFLGSSDQASFDRKGVAILNLSTGYHADYHKPSDEIKKISFKKMKRVAELCFSIGVDVANSAPQINQNTTN